MSFDRMILLSLIALALNACNLVKNKNKASLESTDVAADRSANVDAVNPAAAAAETAEEVPVAPVVETPAVSPPSSPLPQTLKDLGLFEDTKDFSPKSPLLLYEVESPLWSDVAKKSRYISLPEGKALSWDSSTNKLVFPNGTILVKHFAAKADGSSPVETRVMLLLEDKTWAFASYQWKGDGTTSRVTAVTSLEASSDWPSGYRIPSEEECVKCHKAAPSEVLGFQPAQLVSYAPKLLAAKIFNEDLAMKVAAVTPQPSASDATLDIKVRALAYLNVNCGPCHRPGDTNSYLQLNSEDINLDWLVLKKYIVPGKPEESTLYKRFTAEKNRMPPVSVVQDPLGLELFKTWISGYPSSL